MTPDSYRLDGTLWRPPSRGDTRIEELIEATGSRDYAHLHERSVADPAWFWGAVADDLAYPFPTPYDRVLDASGGIERTEWFVGGRTNLALACLRHASERPESVACIGLREDAAPEELSFAELARRVGGAAGRLREAGVGVGDRVGLFAPMSTEALIAYLAILAEGAIVVPLFSGFGAAALDARLSDAEVALLVTATSTVRAGRRHEMAALAASTAYSSTDPARVIELEELCSDSAPFEPTPVPAEAPFMLGYTSGTTARPKGALLSHGGAGVKIASEGAYSFDMRPGDRHLWVTDIGWIMGTWSLVSALANGAAVVMMEGSPLTPDDRLWRICEDQRVTQLGVSPTLVRSLRGSQADEPDVLPDLRAVGSTGEPLDEASWSWLFERLGRRKLPILNISGGTEVGAALLAPTPVTPLVPGTVGTPALGLDLAVLDPQGDPLGPNQVGQLACRNAWPGMTRGIWRAPERFIEAYWSTVPGVWVHGDWASFDENGLWFLHGRSDDTINVAGKRVGPAEIEQVIAEDGAIVAAAVIGVEHATKGESIWALAVHDRRREPDPELEQRLRARVADVLGASFRPERVILVSDLPRTRSQKVARRVIRALATGGEVGDLTGLENPQVVDAIAGALNDEARNR